jgi:ATP-dependent Clp protease protease subunit
MSDITSLPLPRARNLYFYEQVDQDSIKKLVEEIININESDDLLRKLYAVYDFTYTPKPINIYIDSYGGSVYQILGLLSVMDNSKTPIYTYSTGAAMSAGFMILIAGHRRFAYKHSTPLYHQVSSWSFGTLADMQEKVAETKRVQKLLESIILQKTKLTKAKLKEVNVKKIDWYMTPKEALYWGIVDEII